MTQTFGRRAAPAYTAPPREPEIPHEVREALAAVKRPQQDPEFVAWTKARTATRWRIWGMCFLTILGGPMAFFLPDGMGRLAGLASAGIGIGGMILRWRQTFTPAKGDQA